MFRLSYQLLCTDITFYIIIFLSLPSSVVLCWRFCALGHDHSLYCKPYIPTECPKKRIFFHYQLSSQLALEGHVPSNPVFQNGNSESAFFWENLYFRQHKSFHFKLAANKFAFIRCKCDMWVAQCWETIKKGNDHGGKDRSKLYRQGWRLGQSQYQLCSCSKQMLDNVQLICGKWGATKN